MAERVPVVEEPYSADDSAVTPWQEARARLVDGETYWLATLHPDGRPHAVPVLAVWADGAPHFSAGRTTRKARNLARDPRCVLTLGSDGLDLVVDGQAARVTDEGSLQRVAAVYVSKYDWHTEIRDGALHADGAPTAGPPPYDVYRVTAATVLGFGTDGRLSPTRWRF